MIKIIVKYKKEIEEYCAENNLSVEKVFHAPRAYNSTRLILQHYDPEKGKMGLLDETPAAVTLAIFLENGKLRFEQTEHTHKYLGAVDKTGRQVA
ncbi:MAG: hypothetical protein LBC59_06875 [Chitinispirillales bacterium]|jgi:hypothetical protein|nr:hypothetical protein [Chitinispirillales bacterium]